MFGIDSGELIIIAVVALVIIGPKDLPRAMRAIGQWVGRARGMARHFRTGMDAMIREVELEDLEKQWKADNERIMREHPVAPPAPAQGGDSDWGKPAAGDAGSAETPPDRSKAPPPPARTAPPIPASGAKPPATAPDELP